MSNPTSAKSITLHRTEDGDYTATGTSGFHYTITRESLSFSTGSGWAIIWDARSKHVATVSTLTEARAYIAAH